MRLSSALASDFDPTTRSRGADYYRVGAVRIQSGSDTLVEAQVSGSSKYEVELDLDDDGTLNLWCSCPYFTGGSGPCKHLWATILSAESAGYLRRFGNGGPVAVDYDIFGDPIEALPKAPPTPKPPQWIRKLNEVASNASRSHYWPSFRQLLYVIDVPASTLSGALRLEILAREPKRAGGWKKATPPRIERGMIEILPDPADRRILGMLTGIAGQSWSMIYPQEQVSSGYNVAHQMAEVLIPLITATGRGVLRFDFRDEELHPFAWDDGEPWRFELRLEQPSDDKCAVNGVLRRGDREMDVKEPVLVTQGGLVFTRERVSRLDDGGAFQWIAYLRKAGAITARADHSEQLLAALLEHPVGAPVRVPSEIQYEELRVVPRPSLTIRQARNQPERLWAELWFDYQGRRMNDSTRGRAVYDAASRKLLVRDLPAEDAAADFLEQMGLSAPGKEWSAQQSAWSLAARKLPALVRACLDAGWHIEAEGKTFRNPGTVRVEVASGIDWFELHGEVSYGDSSAKLPELLAALRRGENMVRLDDGTYGLLPEEWLSRFGSVAALGNATDGHLRFRRNQAGLLDALLVAQPEAGCDETFARVREELHTFNGIRASAQPEGFVGQLRDYQREGVGWMEFLRRFGFGGCLADDMGVGKTPQVLALLESRRALRAEGSEEAAGSSLVVVPKSLVFNWKQEAARFTPQLRVLDHTGFGRSISSFSEYDVILTTYGTLRRDAVEFKDLEFDYIVLDEAQAIKNAGTESAKAVRLLKARHRLALSGTPVENHLGELWSLFEFLNPGMLGSATVFKLTGASARNPGEETRQLLAHALRPFILRRTKEQVARELPAKSEQTIFCELEAPQRKLYNELRAHYRNTLLRAVDSQGMAKAKIQVLEALLRLRQAACHPGLVDPKRTGDASAKLDMLLEQLDSIVAEGHKALVFSQFTSLLAIVRKRLDATGIPYEYLDGATRDRQECVERFQNEANCPLFLISLKAGGLGLNLTAAEYVFLLDPWWNPAVEAQAIDRSHRIGQTRQVFAYRLIARDTVEEKVLDLQKTKRDLAAAIISEDNSPLRNLKREDLEMLLS